MATLLSCACLGLLLFARAGATAEPLPSVAPDRVGLSASPLAEIDSLMQSYVNDGKLAGIVLLVAREGKIAHAGVYGQMDIESRPADAPRRAVSHLLDDQADHRRGLDDALRRRTFRARRSRVEIPARL